TREYLLTRLAFVYIPFVAISALGAIIWSCALYAAGTFGGNPDRYNQWGRIFLEALNYDLAFTEFVFGSAVALMGLLAIAGVARYALSRTTTELKLTPGLVAQNWVSMLLTVSPLILVAVVVCFFANAWLPKDQTGDTHDVLRIYSLSAMRALPYVP